MTKTLEELEALVTKLDEEVAEHERELAMLHTAIYGDRDAIANWEKRKNDYPFPPAPPRGALYWLDKFREIHLELYGDVEARDRWDRAAAYQVGSMTGTRPPGGFIELVTNKLVEQNTRLADAISALEHGFGFVKKLQAYFEPFLRDKNPPLDGAYLVDEEKLNQRLEMLARALRTERAEGEAKITTLMDSDKREIVESLTEIAEVVKTVVHQSQHQKPSRLVNVMRAILGDEPNSNGRPQ